jgi:hypothetical protein
MSASMQIGAKQTENCEIVWGYVIEEGNGMPTKFITSPCNEIELDLEGRNTVTIVFNREEHWEISETNNYRVDN